MRVGLDEAGKGPVIGSMFAAAVATPAPDRLPSGIDDSKILSDARRESLFEMLTEAECVYTATAEITPAKIDAQDSDMNTLTVQAHAGALKELLAAIPGESHQVIADAGDTDAERFGVRVATRCGADIDVRAVHGADGTYPIVGAASIVAKTAREDHVAALRETYGAVGSGYPSDPETRAFLESYLETHGELPSCARASWATSRRLRAASAQSSLEDF